MSESIVIGTEGGEFNAYVARPRGEVAATVVVLHEIFGVNADMRDRCGELATLGYIAVCPDLFWRQEPGVDISDQTHAEWKKGMDLYTAFSLSAGVSDIAATIKKARSLEGASGKVGVTGYCLGGLMTFLAAAKLDVEATAIYYPGGADHHLRAMNGPIAPTLIHLAGEDEYIPEGGQRKIAAALAGQPDVEVYTYPGCQHAFARHRGIHYDAAAASLANGRTAQFLKRHLQS